MYGTEEQRGGFDPDVFYYLTLYNQNYPMPAMPDRPRPGRHHARAVPRRAARRGQDARRHAAVLRHGRPGCARGHDGPRRAATTSASSCGRRRRTRRCATRRSRSSGGTGCTPARNHACPVVAAAARRRPGADRRRHRLHEDRAGAGRPVRAEPAVRSARHRRHGPQRHPRGAAPALRDRRPARRRRRAVGARMRRARSTPRRSRRRSPTTASTPTCPTRRSCKCVPPEAPRRPLLGVRRNAVHHG